MARKITTIDEYLERLDPQKRDALTKLRRIIRTAAPKAEECISYQLCAFKQNGLLVGFGATGNHCALYLMNGSTVGKHKEALKQYTISKGTIRFQPEKPIPTALVRKLVRERLAENNARA
jgi:uncharacterized protein YdhG (YjbR/CyaY superfamily)